MAGDLFRDLKKLAAVIGALGAAAITIAPVMLQYRAMRDELGLARAGTEHESLSADISSSGLASPHLAVWPLKTPPHRSETAAYPGIAIGGLVLAVGVAQLRRRSTPFRRPPPLLIGTAGIAIAMILFGAVAIDRPYKVIGAGLDVLLIVLLVSKPFRDLIRSGSIPALYLTGLAVAGALSLGPVGRVFGHRFWYKAPFAWLMTLPGYDWARVPARFSSIEVLCLAVLTAYAVVRLWPGVTRASLMAMGAIAALIVVDGWRLVPVVRVPAPVDVALAADLVIELPTHGWEQDVRAMYRGMFHGRPVMNGYSGFVPPHYVPLQLDLREDCVKSIEAVRNGRSVDALIWRAEPGAGEIDSGLRQLWPAATREEMPDVIVYRQPRSLPADLKNADRCQ